MKILIIVILSLCIGILYTRNRLLKKELASKTPVPYYKSNLSREEMKEALYNSTNDSISMVVPGDTSVMPYLIRRPADPIQCEYVRR